MTPAGLLAAAISILIIGDSHVAGKQAGPDGPSFAEVMQEELGEEFEVVAAGCPGSTTRDWVSTLPSFDCSMGNAYAELARPHLPADLVIVLLGTNDAVGYMEPEPLPPGWYRAMILAIHRKLREDGVPRTLVLPPPPFPALVPGVNLRLRAYGRELRAAAAETPGLVVGPDLNALLVPKLHLQRWQAHMTAAGHRLIGEKLAAAVRKLFEDEPEAALSHLPSP